MGACWIARPRWSPATRTSSGAGAARGRAQARPEVGRRRGPRSGAAPPRRSKWGVSFLWVGFASRRPDAATGRAAGGDRPRRWGRSKRGGLRAMGACWIARDRAGRPRGRTSSGAGAQRRSKWGASFLWVGFASRLPDAATGRAAGGDRRGVDRARWMRVGSRARAGRPSLPAPRWSPREAPPRRSKWGVSVLWVGY